jgi:hypothetical protein
MKLEEKRLVFLKRLDELLPLEAQIDALEAVLSVLEYREGFGRVDIEVKDRKVFKVSAMMTLMPAKRKCDEE